MSLNIKEILAIDGGLSFIQSRWPQTQGAETSSRTRFKLRDEEKTASGAMKQTKDGHWIVTDFGGDQKGRNAVDLLMYMEGFDFPEALRIVAAYYDILPGVSTGPTAEYNKWPAKPDEIEGQTTYQAKELTEAEARVVLTDSAWKALGFDPSKRLEKAKHLFARYHLKSLEWRRFTSKGVTHEFRSTEHYPIFLYEEVNPDTKAPFGRFYEPKAGKKDRFRYLGEKPRTYIHGLEQAKTKLESKREEEREKLREDGKLEEREIFSEADKVKLSEILICSGGSDALNAAACGFEVVWRNSESEPWLPKEIKDLQNIAEVVVNVPDIDATGLEQAHKLGLQYLDIHTLYLPDYITSARGANGNPLNKDLRDYLRSAKPAANSVSYLSPVVGKERVASVGVDSYSSHTASDFKKLVETAMPYEFWDRDIKLNKKGEPIRRHGRTVMQYTPRIERMLHFLFRCGFCQIPSDQSKDGFQPVYIEGNIVNPMEHISTVAKFVKEFLKSRYASEDLLDAFNRSPALSDTSLSNLYIRRPDFKHYGADHQYFFFESTVWRIMRDKVEQLTPLASGKHVWREKVLTMPVRGGRPEKPEILQPLFNQETLPSGQVLVRVLDNSGYFFQYLMQTCRVHWRTELEERLYFFEKFNTPEKQDAYIEANHIDDGTLEAIRTYARSEASREEYRRLYHVSLEGPILTPAERDEQCGHLANRLYVIGYALHRYKISSRPWAVWAMDYKLVDESAAHGGTGKSLVTTALSFFQKQLGVNSRSETSKKNDFQFEELSAATDLILFDDADAYIDFTQYYEQLTGKTKANRKNISAITLDFVDSPKWWFNSNFGDRHTDPSSLRRKIYTVYSDYYHKDNGEYGSDRTPRTDLGVELFNDFDNEQWNAFYNLYAQALQFYLRQSDPVLAPGQNITMRNLIAAMGDNFRAWADVYFHPSSLRLNVEHPRQEAYEDYQRNNTKLSPQGWMKRLKAWCQYNFYTLNPPDKCNQGTRIVRYQNGTTVEMLYISAKTNSESEQMVF